MWTAPPSNHLCWHYKLANCDECLGQQDDLCGACPDAPCLSDLNIDVLDGSVDYFETTASSGWAEVEHKKDAEGNDITVDCADVRECAFGCFAQQCYATGPTYHYQCWAYQMKIGTYCLHDHQSSLNPPMGI